jgi:GAF domain-containing protein
VCRGGRDWPRGHNAELPSRRKVGRAASPLGYVGAWSLPIKSREEGRVLGTFGTYYRTQRKPTEEEIQIVRELADVAAIALHGES